MANLNELFPKNSFTMSGPLGGFMGGLSSAYALNTADQDIKDRDLKYNRDSLRYDLDQAEAPSQRSTYALTDADAQMRKRLIDSGLVEESARDKIATEREVNKGKRSEAAVTQKAEQNDDIIAFNEYFQSLPQDQKLGDHVQNKWMEWAGYLNNKYKMKVPEMYTPEAQAQLAAYARAAASSAQSVNAREMQTLNNDASYKKTKLIQEAQTQRNNDTIEARLQVADLVAQTALNRVSTTQGKLEAQGLISGLRDSYRSRLAAIDSSIVAIQAAYADDPAKREADTADMNAQKTALEESYKAKVQEIVATVEAKYKTPGARPSTSSVFPKAGQTAAETMMPTEAEETPVPTATPEQVKGAAAWKPGSTPEVGKFYKNPTKPGVLYWDPKAKAFLAAREAK